MKAIFLAATVLGSALCVSTAHAQDALPSLEGPYLGQTPPGKTAEVFAPGVISTDQWEYGAVFAPGMRELYWVREVPGADPERQFVVYEEKDGRWKERLLGERRGTPTLSTDGQTMFFGRSFKERTPDGWSDFKRLGAAFEDIRIMRVTESAQNTIVFDEASENGTLRYSRMIDGKREDPKPLPAVINTGEWNAHPFIAPDETYIIWDGQRGIEGRNADLFISFKQPDGNWGEAKKFGDGINTSMADFAAFVTPDGKYLFFNRTVGVDGDGNSNVDIMWVDAKVIEDLRPTP